MWKTDNGEHSGRRWEKLRKRKWVLTGVTVGVGPNGGRGQTGQTRGPGEPSEPCQRAWIHVSRAVFTVYMLNNNKILVSLKMKVES